MDSENKARQIWAALKNTRKYDVTQYHSIYHNV